MNRRYFLTAMGGATAAAASLVHVNRALAAETTTSFYVKGLILVGQGGNVPMLKLHTPGLNGL